ncbi:MAG: RAMP superfamily CRISPR-associated protein [Candidatus Freyarchaeota archaeon]
MSSKPFTFIPIPREPPSKWKITPHIEFQHLTGKVDLEVEVSSEYLFVGSGSYEFNPRRRQGEADVWHVFHRSKGTICIPGSSIKGAVRTLVEAISNSCVSTLKSKERKAVGKKHARCNPEEGELCVGCNLFGAAGYRGRISFSDAFPTGDVKLVKVKIGELFTPKRFKGRKIYENRRFQPLDSQHPEANHRFVEAAPRNTKFKTTLHFENVSEEELGIVFHALGWKTEGDKVNTAFSIKVGGAKPRCFGAVTIKPVKATTWNIKNLKPSLTTYTGKNLTQFIKECLSKGKKLLHEDAYNKLLEALTPKSQPCPTREY